MVAFNDDYNEKLSLAWEKFIQYEDYDYSFIRSEILNSWQRSRAASVDPFSPKTPYLSQDKLNHRINRNRALIDIVHPYMEMLYTAVGGAQFFLILFDKDGYIIDLLGNEEMIQKSQETKLVLGASRSENYAGTNAMNLSCTLKRPMSVYANEHYIRPHKTFTSNAAPIYDPLYNIAGSLNISGHAFERHPHTLGMVTAAADGITKELRLSQSCRELNDMCLQRDRIIETVGEGLILLNSSNRIIQINKNASRMLGISPSAALGKAFDQFLAPKSVSAMNNDNLLLKETDNEETDFLVNESSIVPVRLNMSVNFVADSLGNRTGLVIKLTEPKKIHTLVNQISGYRSYYSFSSIIGNSSAIKRTLEIAKKAASTDSNVLILGESGTGKELIAHSIHNASQYSKGPFVPINCGALPQGLIESELFGYEKGSFTGASKEGKPGKFELANGGTIFFDEIGDMALDLQVCLLRALESKQITRIGAKYPRDIDVRVIAATNKDIMEAIKMKAFREDLYYRLNVFTVDIPPLSARENDVILLADYFLACYNKRKNTTHSISPEVYEILRNYSWPGNVRELENALERAFNISPADVVTLDCLPDNIVKSAENNPIPATCPVEVKYEGAKALSLNDAEKQLILGNLNSFYGNIKKTADVLGISRRTLYRKLEKYGIDSNTFR